MLWPITRLLSSSGRMFPCTVEKSGAPATRAESMPCKLVLCGGIGTPGFFLGEALVERLREHAEITFAPES